MSNFDGVHRGHARLIAEVVAQADRLQAPTLVMTFDPPPQAILVPADVCIPLTPIPRRADLLSELGVDMVVAYPTDGQLLSLSARDFFQQIIVNTFHASGMVEGPNFRFGRDRSGGVDLLDELCRHQAISFSVVEAAADATGMISSTRIRGLLADGDIAAANAMLTQSYQLSGIVSPGAQRGRELGFPTANLTDIAAFIPAHGVYAGCVTIAGRRFQAAINIGPNPTFDEAQAKVEVHILGWSGTLYGQSLCCTLTKRIREVRRFASVGDLRAQIEKDVAEVANGH
ncbi:MAG: riboflavin biosynthesis protein RibF [Pirellulaceae bacterium]